MNNEAVTQQAIAYVKSHKSIFIDAACKNTSPEENPVAVFMAGTPGAGKTEISKSIITLFSSVPTRIDADEFRSLIPGYDGSNSHLIQPAAALAVDKVLDIVIKNKLSFILDGTFAIKKSAMNIKRALRNGFTVHIYFVYQDPKEAWEFTKIREELEGRRVPLSIFIDAYYRSRENVQNVKNEFQDTILLQAVVKSYNSGEEHIYSNVTDLDKILPILYNKDELKELLNGKDNSP